MYGYRLLSIFSFYLFCLVVFSFKIIKGDIRTFLAGARPYGPVGSCAVCLRSSEDQRVLPAVVKGEKFCFGNQKKRGEMDTNT